MATGEADRPDERAASAAWRDAMLAAACIAVDPAGLGGVRIRSGAGPARDTWLRCWRSMLAPSARVRAVPLHADAGRLFGALDLAASLSAGRPVATAGLFAEVAGGYAVLSMAERIDAALAARIAAHVEASHCAAIACDEGDGDEGIAPVIDERLALVADLRGVSLATMASDVDLPSKDAVARAAVGLSAVSVPDDCVAALCATAMKLGIRSLRMPLFAVRVARAVAALAGRDAVEERDAIVAARLVLGPRATSLDAGDADPPAETPQARPPNEGRADASASDPSTADDPDRASDARDHERPQALDEVVLDATIASLPAGLLDALVRRTRTSIASRGRSTGAGATARGGRRGAPIGVRRGRPDGTLRLSLIETLRAAAPWQRVRRVEDARAGRPATKRIRVHPDDLHVVRFRQRHATTTVFVVDASGSSALHRLAEAKGAVERLLADCYVRRDSVAVIAFRGRTAETLLPPTRSLVRARRSLAGLPGGGGTPLASALDATRETVASIRRHGDTVLVVLLTDGRANVSRDGSGGRPRAEQDALAAARSLRELAVDALLIDTSPHASREAERIAAAMGALYRPLPHADAAAMSAAVRQVSDRTRSATRGERR